MGKILQKDLEKLYNKLICTQTIETFDEKVFGDTKLRVMKFDIYDGFAYCSNYKGDEYCMTYPQMEFLKLSKDMTQVIKEIAGLNDTDVVGVTDILLTYRTLIKI